MAQHDYTIANQGFPAFRSDLNNALSAIQTNNSGTSRPTGAVAGQIWLDTTNATSPTLKFFDGSDDISLATINYSANTVDWLDSSVTITGLSTTATGTVLTLSDSASTSSVNLIIDNQKEVRFRETTANGTNYVALKAPASVASDLTFTLPATDGTNGQVLSTNGSGVLSFTTPASGIAWQSSVKTSGFTATAGEGYFCNTTSAGFTVTLPATPTAGQQVALVDYAGTFDTNALVISPNGNKIEGATSNLQLSGEREGVLLVYIDSTQGWLATSGINEGTDALAPVAYSVDFLVVAGGGGGGSEGGGGGGGGAGGFRTSTQTVNVGTVITVTVGDGGALSVNNSASYTGSDSSISGSGLTTITSAGGGGGGTAGSAGKNGGSGGGGAGGNSGIATGGSGNTPSTSPSQGNNGGTSSTPYGYNGSGGGGAGAVGTSNVGADGGTSGNGGNGTASSITGSSVTYAGGGAGGTYNGTQGTAGSGGGGTGGKNLPSNINGGNGTANLGGGGGGHRDNPSGAGGKGVVILSVPTARYSSTTTGSPTVTTSGSNTILQFNGSGSYTA
jgi:fibronectin-binding autotransporter adhesin